jgi:hypothetical protein
MLVEENTCNSTYHTNCNTIKTSEGQDLEKVEDFQYLGSWMTSSDKDFSIGIAKASVACSKMKAIW